MGAGQCLRLPLHRPAARAPAREAHGPERWAHPPSPPRHCPLRAPPHGAHPRSLGSRVDVRPPPQAVPPAEPHSPDTGWTPGGTRRPLGATRHTPREDGGPQQTSPTARCPGTRAGLRPRQGRGCRAWAGGTPGQRPSPAQPEAGGRRERLGSGHRPPTSPPRCRAALSRGDGPQSGRSVTRSTCPGAGVGVGAAPHLGKAWGLRGRGQRAVPWPASAPALRSPQPPLWVPSRQEPHRPVRGGPRDPAEGLRVAPRRRPPWAGTRVPCSPARWPRQASHPGPQVLPWRELGHYPRLGQAVVAPGAQGPDAVHSPARLGAPGPSVAGRAPPCP